LYPAQGFARPLHRGRRALRLARPPGYFELLVPDRPLGLTSRALRRRRGLASPRERTGIDP
jgi:hypothetical protein